MSHTHPHTVRLHFTLGPVQGFVGESRRTRDLWGSSFMLSYLVGHALAAVRSKGATVILPDIGDDALLDWIENNRATAPPTIGSIPNRFTVEFEPCDGEEEKQVRKRAAEAAEAGKAAVHKAWMHAANAVREEYFGGARMAQGKESRTIWNRQVEHFWDVAWILTCGEDLTNFAALDVRKNWRTKDYAPEAGDKCSIMTGWQELSGFVRSWPVEKTAQTAFWEAVRGQTADLDLQDGEQLCAVAAVKRLYPRVNAILSRAALEALDSNPVDAGNKGFRLRGEGNKVNWPSTRFMAAIPWLERVLADHESAADTFLAEMTAADVKLEQAERHSSIQSLAGFKHGLRALDSNLYDERSLKNPRVTGLSPRGSTAALAALQKLTRAVGESPSTYYALLLMDGDRMGKLLRTFAEAGKIQAPTTALSTFSRGVPELVEAHNGVTVYAGGDDVLALLPLPDAVACALALEGAYRGAFKDAIAALSDKHREGTRATLSASLIFADAQLPLRQVLGEAHHLLDKVAKEENGRDSIAVALWKPSGVTAQWVTTWPHLRGPGTGESSTDPAHALGKLGGYFRATSRGADPRRERALISNSLLYRWREQLSQLFEATLDVPGTVEQLPDGFDNRIAGNLMMALLIQSQEISGDAGVEACTRAIAEVRAICQQHRNRPLISSECAPERTFTFDALVLARFLARGGQEDV